MSNSEDPPVLRDLQGLLRKSIGDSVVVVNYKTSMLLPKGENYGSTILKVDTLIKKTKDLPEEEMHLVAKMIPNQEFQRQRIDLGASIAKEIYATETLAKFYRQLDREAGFKEEDQLDVFPNFYGGRLTRNEKNPNKADEDAVILLENLKFRGYDTIDRFKGLDFEHMKYTLIRLAHFHALGMALREKKSKQFDDAKKPIDAAAFNFPRQESNEVINQTIELLSTDSRIKKYVDRIKRSFETSGGFDAYFITEQVEPWVSIVHGDTWINNLLFRHAENGKIDDLKFIDYQLSRICSPLRDIPYFLSTSSDHDVMDNHFDELLNIYHAKFLEELSKFGCDATPFSKRSFEEEMTRISFTELFRCILTIKIVTMEVPQNMDMSDIKSSIILGDGNKSYFDRSWKIISKFVEKGWI